MVQRLKSQKEIIAATINPHYSTESTSRHKQELRIALWLQRDFAEILEATRHPKDRDNDPTFIHAHIATALSLSAGVLKPIPEEFTRGIRVAMYSLWFTKLQTENLQNYLDQSETKQEGVAWLLYNGLVEHYYRRLQSIYNQDLFLSIPEYSGEILRELRLTEQPHAKFLGYQEKSVKLLSQERFSMWAAVQVGSDCLLVRKDWIKTHG